MALPVAQTTSADQIEAKAERLLRAAHQRMVAAKPAEMAAFFQRLLGQQLTALMTGTADPKAIGKWARGERAPRGATERRLRDGYHVAMLLTLAEGEETARAWLLGMNPILKDRPPLTIIGESPDGAERVMGAARAYLAHG
jgi:hypothetical protein